MAPSAAKSMVSVVSDVAPTTEERLAKALSYIETVKRAFGEDNYENGRNDVRVERLAVKLGFYRHETDGPDQGKWRTRAGVLPGQDAVAVDADI